SWGFSWPSLAGWEALIRTGSVSGVHVSITAFFRSLLQRPSGCSSNRWELACQQDHTLATFEQGDWLAELELLQLANALQRTAISRGGYDGRSFDLMFAIADVLEADHGWSFEQSDAWLERMGLWEEEF
ncbi:MAG: hypothetical protein RLZZ255_1450, partial [Cyanobacteriota bacterium]